MLRRLRLAAALVSCLIAPLSLTSCGTEPVEDVTVTESPLITYPTGTMCPFTVNVGVYCAPLPNRTMRCWQGSNGEQVVGCKWPVTGPIGYNRLCVLSCP